MTQFTVTPSSNTGANSSSTRAAARTQQQRSKTPRYLSALRILVAISISAMLSAGAAAGGTLTRNLAGAGRYFRAQYQNALTATATPPCRPRTNPTRPRLVYTRGRVGLADIKKASANG